MANVEIRQQDLDKMSYYKTYCNTRSKTYRVCKYDSYWGEYKRLDKDDTYEGAVAKAIEASKKYGCTTYVLTDSEQVVFDVTR